MTIAIIGTLASLALPGYARFTARAYRTEMREFVQKLALYFNGLYADTGSYGADIGDVQQNPPGSSPPPVPGLWDPQAHGWSQVPLSLDGGVRMRYWYAISGGGTQLVLQAQGSFPGVGSYLFSETFVNGALVLTSEVPSF